MSSRVSYHDQFFYISNMQFSNLIEFGMEVAGKSAETDNERSFLHELRLRSEAYSPGYDLDIEEEFPSCEERKFWARIFYDVAYLIFRREIGNHAELFWQHTVIGDAYSLARMLTRSVQEEELAWHPKTLASIEAERFYNGNRM